MVLVLLVIPSLISVISIGQRNIVAEDPVGDAIGDGVSQDAIASVDIKHLGVYGREDGMTIVLAMAGSLLEEGTYIFRIGFYGDDSSIEVIIGPYTPSADTDVPGFIEGSSAMGDFRYPVSVSIEGSTIMVEVDATGPGASFMLNMLPTHNSKLKSLNIIVESSYATIDGSAHDELQYSVNLESGGGAGVPTTTMTREEPMMTMPKVVFRDLGAKASGVDVSITGTPSIRIYTVEGDGIYYTVIEARVEGTSRGADHVGVVIEFFSNGDLVDQELYNMMIYGGIVDDDGAGNGYSYDYVVQIPNTQYKMEIHEHLEPKGGSWSSWAFTAEYKIPGIHEQGISNLKEAIEALKGGKAEVYVTAVAFKDGGETQYTTASKQVKVTIEDSVAPGASVEAATSKATSVTTSEGGTEGGGASGASMAVVAAAIIIVLAVAGFVFFKFR